MRNIKKRKQSDSNVDALSFNSKLIFSWCNES